MASTSQAVTTLKAQLFVDLDGVLASYDEGFFRTFACTSVEAEERGLKIWDMIGAHPDFYANLDPLPGALDFWREILDHYPHPVILTTTPTLLS